MKKFIVIIFCGAMALLYSCGVPQSKYDAEKERADSLQRIVDAGAKIQDGMPDSVRARLSILSPPDHLTLAQAQRLIYDKKQVGYTEENIFLTKEALMHINRDLDDVANRYPQAITRGIHMHRLKPPGAGEDIWLAWAAITGAPCDSPPSVWQLQDYKYPCLCRPCCATATDCP
jgi:hypothetical protein